MKTNDIHSLLKDAYWCRGIPEHTIEKAMNNSLCFGVVITVRTQFYGREKK